MSTQLSSNVSFGLVRFFALIAAGISLYLLYHSLTGSSLPGCGVESGCGTVLNSRWAYILGWPVSLPALLLYLAILGATVVVQRDMAPRHRQRLEGMLVFAATALILAAMWFVGLQFIVMRAICPFCMAAHTCGLIVGLLLLKQILGADRKNQPPRSGQNSVPMPTGLVAKWAIAGMASTALLAAGQILHQPKTYDVQPLASGTAFSRPQPGGSLPTNAAVRQPMADAANSSSAPPPQKESRIISLHDGIFNLDLGNVPLMGVPEAPQVIVHLFDYSCEHCRQLHPLLVEVSRNLSNQLAIVSLPAPLSTNCNHLIKRVIPAHTNACEYARAGLAVWRANPARLPQFEDWIFTPPRPPSPEAVRAQARILVGTNAFERALGDPWVEEQMSYGMRILGTNYARYRKGQLPQLMIGSNIVSGVIRKTGDLYRLLSNQFNVKIPDNQAATNAAIPH